jgi:ADP-ribose pyrophosphatase YjhB (NUDIX family)
MASVGPRRHYVVVVLNVGGTKLSNVKFVLQREPRTGKTWFPADSVTANEEHVDVAVRELHEETSLILTPDDLTLLIDALFHVALPVGQHLVYVYSAYVHVTYVTTNLRTLALLEQAVTTQSTINPDGSYVVRETIDVGGLNLTPGKTGLLHAMKHKSELLHFGYVTQWETFRRALYTSQALFHDDTTIPRQFFMYPRFSSVDYGHVWLLIRGYINQLCGETPIDLQVGTPMPTTNMAGLPVTLAETQRKAAVNSPFQSGADARELEDMLEAQHQRFLLLGITADSYDSVIWVTSQFSGHLNGWWLNRKVQASIPSTFDLLVVELQKTTFLLNIQDDAIDAVLNRTQGCMSYVLYTQRFIDFLRRSRQKLTADVQFVRFINGRANFELKTQAKSHRSQRGYNVQLVKLQTFLNDVVSDSPQLGGMRSTTCSSTSLGGGQPTKTRNLEDPLVGASKLWKRNGGDRGRGRGQGGNQGGGRGRPSANSRRIDLKAIANALTPEERKKHIEEGLCFKCHKKGHRLFQCLELKGKARLEYRRLRSNDGGKDVLLTNGSSRLHLMFVMRQC